MRILYILLTFFCLQVYASNEWNLPVPSLLQVSLSKDSSRDSIYGIESRYYTKKNYLIGASYNEAITSYAEQIYKTKNYAMQIGSDPLEDMNFTLSIGRSLFEKEIFGSKLDLDITLQSDSWAFYFSPEYRNYLVQGLTKDNHISNDFIFSLGFDYSWNLLTFGLSATKVYYGINPNDIYSTGLINDLTYAAESKILSLEDAAVFGSLKSSFKDISFNLWGSVSRSKIFETQSLSYGLRSEITMGQYYLTPEIGQSQTASTTITIYGLGLGFLF